MRTIYLLLALFAIGLFIMADTGCATGGGGGGGGGVVDDGGQGEGEGQGEGDGEGEGEGEAEGEGEGGGEGEFLIKTHICMDTNTLIMRPKAGDDLIVWGDMESVYYIIPSETDTETEVANEVPEGGRFAWTHFAVAGKKILLVTDLGEVRVFHAGTGGFRDFSPDEILLANVQLTDDTMPGLTQASGDVFVTINNNHRVVDGNVVKVIDVAGDDPEAWTVTAFANPIDEFENPVEEFDQVAVDAETRRVLGVGNGDVYVWDLDDPAADPIYVDLGLNTGLGGINEQRQLQFEGDYVLYHQDPDDFPLGIGITNAALLNVVEGTVTVFTNNPSQQNVPVALAGGSFIYTQWREELDSQMGAGASYRSAIGAVADAPDSTLASQFNTYALRPSVIDFGIISQEQCFGEELKLVGYGSSMCVTPDGTKWFIAGEGPIDYTWDYLQMSEGGEFTDFEDPEGNTTSGSVMATDVTCSSNVVAFRALRATAFENCITEEEWVVGFILLDRMD